MQDFLPLLDFVIQIDPEIQTTIRTNKTLITALASTGGIAGLISLFFRIFLRYIQRGFFQLEMQNEIF